MSLDLDDSLLRSVVDGMADEQGRISVEDFSRMICEHMGSSIEVGTFSFHDARQFVLPRRLYHSLALFCVSVLSPALGCF